MVKDKRLLPPSSWYGFFDFTFLDVQGLGDDNFHKVKGLFNQELSSQYVSKFDVLLMQEHHLSQNRVSKICKFMKEKWFYDWIPAFECMFMKEKGTCYCMF